MADSKITGLAALTTADPANDMLPIVDVSDNSMAASGTTKRISINNILACSPSATLASATITGALTAAGNSVIGTGSAQNAAAGRGNLTIGGTASAILNLSINSADTGYVIHDGTNISLVNRIAAGSLIFQTNSSTRYQIASDGVATWSNVGGGAGTAMTLNSSGLFLGISSQAFAEKFRVYGSYTLMDDGAFTGFLGKASSLGVSGATTDFAIRSSNALIFLSGGATERMRIDTSGNLGIGVQPSAWAAGYKAIQGQAGGFALSNDNSSNNQFRLSSNAYFDTTDNRWEYYGTSTATAYEQRVGEHRFFNAPSGTVNTAITFTQAMTLDASGNLLIGTTSSPLASRVSVGVTNAQPDSFVIRNSDATAGLYWRLAYVNSSNTFHILNQSGVGVYLTDGATSWTGTSDERLKDIIEPISNAVAKVGSLRSVIGKFKTDSEGTRRSFLIAQDVQAVLPEAVDTTNADAFGVRYTEVIPLLVAAIKELTARVQTLETR